MCIDIEMLFSIIQVEKVWCGILVSAAGFINNGGMQECSVAGIQTKTVYCRMDGGTRHVNLWGSVHMATICITSLQKMTNHKRPNVTRSIRC